MYMPGSPSTSFIPKRNPSQNDKRVSKKTLYLGSFFIRIIFVAALLATVAVFLYERTVKSALEDEIIALNTSIATFNEEDMKRVLELDLRLNQMSNRLANTASIVSLLTALEATTIASAQIENFAVERTNDSVFKVNAQIKTSSFDSVLFQRKLYEESKVFTISEITDVRLENQPPDNGLFAEDLVASEEGVRVSFNAVLAVDTDQIPHTTSPISLPSAAVVPVTPATPVTTATTSVSSTEETEPEVANQTDI